MKSGQTHLYFQKATLPLVWVTYWTRIRPRAGRPKQQEAVTKDLGGGLDRSSGDVDERGRWTDESAGTGKAGTKANVTKGGRMGVQDGKNTLRSFWSTP